MKQAPLFCKVRGGKIRSRFNPKGFQRVADG